MNRRAFLTGAVAAPLAARTGVAVAAGGAPTAKQEIVRRGRAIAVVGKRVVVAHDRRRTIAIGSQVIDVGGMPVDVAISADGRLAAVTTGFWDQPGLALVDVANATLLDRVDVGPAPGAVTFIGKRRILVAGGEQEGTATVVDARRRAVVSSTPIGVLPRGIAGRWIALAGEDKLVHLSGRELRVPALPERLALHGHRLLVAHAHSEYVSLVDTKTRDITRRRAGGMVSGVAFTREGKPVVALPGAIRVLGSKRHRTVAAPRGLVVAGRRAWTVDDLSGQLGRVKL